jgi:hypothetical protein
MLSQQAVVPPRGLPKAHPLGIPTRTGLRLNCAVIELLESDVNPEASTVISSSDSSKVGNRTPATFERFFLPSLDLTAKRTRNSQ